MRAALTTFCHHGRVPDGESSSLSLGGICFLIVIWSCFTLI